MMIMALLMAFVLNSPKSIDYQLHSDTNPVDYGEWKLVKNTGGVQTFFRWTRDSKGTSLRERKGVMTVNCSVQDAVKLLTDAGSTGKWMSGISENYNIARISQTEWYTYTLFSIPWPFSKRDLVSLNRMASDPSRGTVSIAIACQDRYVPLKPGITRLTDYHANWVITKLGDKTITISFSAMSSAPPVFPRPIQDPVIEKIFHNNLVRLRETLST